MTDIEELRAPAIRLHGLTKAEAPYRLYYDESGNIRKLAVRPNTLTLNNPNPGGFILGGVALRSDATKLNAEDLRSVLKLQSNISDIKFKHVTRGDLHAVLGSRKLRTFLNWYVETQAWVHLTVLDPLYFGIVDIIDTILAEAMEPSLFSIHFELKASLYRILRSADAKGMMLPTLARFNYPNVASVEAREFFSDLIVLVESNQHLLEPFAYQMLKGVLQMGSKQDSLPFLDGTDAGTFLANFVPVFAHRIYMLKNAQHIFDDETKIERPLKAMGLRDGAHPLQNYRFVNSRSEFGVQVSDIWVGLFARLFNFARGKKIEEIQSFRESLDSKQTEALSAVSRIYRTSLDENSIFGQWFISQSDRYVFEGLFSS